MKYVVVSMRDKVSQAFESVNLDVNEFTARRNFAYAVNNSSELLFKSKDIELYKVSYFDSDTGLFEPVVPMVRICSGDEVVQNDKT